MSLTYATYLTTMATLTNISASNADFLSIMPTTIDNAEGRVYRELEMLTTQIVDGSSSFTANTRSANLPTSIGVYQVVDGINVITPTATAPDSGTRHPLIPVSRDFLDMTWPSSTGATVPQYFCYLSQSVVSGQKNFIVGPWPDAAYRFEVIGTQQPTALSSGNTTTFLTLYLPDLFVAASMVFMTGYQQNFGSQADNPPQGTSWEAYYQILKSSAATWEAQKRFSGPSWTSKPPEPVAQPQRG